MEAAKWIARNPTGSNQYNGVSAIQRFESHYMPVTESGCWLWESNLNDKGYGRFYLDGKNVRAHRWAYEHYREPIPVGLDLDHLCRVRCCVNPWHLEPVTKGVNVLRGEGVTARLARQTHCLRGHELSGYNCVPWLERSTWRACRTCQRISSSAWKARRRASAK